MLFNLSGVPPLGSTELLQLRELRCDGFLLIRSKAIPGNDLTQRVFSFKRVHRPALANMVSQLNLELSEQKLKELDERYRLS